MQMVVHSVGVSNKICPLILKDLNMSETHGHHRPCSGVFKNIEWGKVHFEGLLVIFNFF